MDQLERRSNVYKTEQKNQASPDGGLGHLVVDDHIRPVVAVESGPGYGDFTVTSVGITRKEKGG